MSRQATRRVTLLAAVLTIVSCKEQGKTQSSPEQALLANAIAAQGGRSKLERGSSYSARIETTLVGPKVKGTIKYRAGALRLEYLDAQSKNPVVQVAGDGLCWQRIGKVVVPCHEGYAAHVARVARMLQASALYPLSTIPLHEQTGLQVKAAGDGRLTVSKGAETFGTLVIDPKTYLVGGFELQTTLMGKPGSLVVTFSKHEKHCGVQVPTERLYTFAGQEIGRETIDGVLCEKLDDAVFERPAQVAHGTVEIRHAFDTPLACTELKGALSGVRPALDKLVGYLSDKALPPTGAAVLIHRKGAPRVTKPAGYVTDVCFPVGDDLWEKPKADWSGDFYRSRIVTDEVLAGYGVGPLDKLAAELPKLLLDEAKKQGRKQAGPLRQILYLRPGDFPPEQQVVEMHLPLD